MSHTNEKGMVVGKRYMLTDNSSGEDIIYILKYSRFLNGAERDEYEVEYLFNVDTGKLETPKPPSNIKYSKGVGLITDVIDMEEIEKEMNVVGDNPKSYFKACLEIYNRLTGKFSGEDPDDDTDIKDPVDFLIARRTKREEEEEERKWYESVYGLYETGGRNLEGARRGGGKKDKTKKKKRKSKSRKSKKKKKSKTRRRR